MTASIPAIAGWVIAAGMLARSRVRDQRWKEEQHFKFSAKKAGTNR